MKNTFARFLKARKDTHTYNRYPRKLLDELLEYLRFTKVAPHVPKGATLLDIGTGDGTFLHYLNGHTHGSVGIDPHLTHTYNFDNFQLIPGYFPDDFAVDNTFDVITMMAVAEHIPMQVYPDIETACWKYLKPNGHVILTVPHPRIDGFLYLLKKLRILEGFSLQEHYGFDPEYLPQLFNRWELVKKERWELGCNHLFIFRKRVEKAQ